MNYYLAIDIGASSGRHIVGYLENGSLQTKEVYRFPNGVHRVDGHLVWDMEALLREVVQGIDAALAAYPNLKSLSIDTWGVDYLLLCGDEVIGPAYAYRDDRTQEAIRSVHAILPFDELYAHTGIQFQPFNTIYQLYADLQAGRLERATDFLMIPEYLLYRLTGVKAQEYTNATTGGLVSAETGQYDRELLQRLKLPERLFGTLRQPGTLIGSYKGIRCLLCATHDTASAVEGMQIVGRAPYISSGTWSLLGVKTQKPLTDAASRDGNWSNEGGVGYIRYQKNIMGMWLVNELRRELCPALSFPELTKLAQESRCDILIDANAPDFLSPSSMKAAFDAAIGHPLPEAADYFRCAYRSLAESYRTALDELERNTKQTYRQLYLAGGGAKNTFLNQLTAEATGKQVIALPIEATAIGNLKIQMEADQ